MRMFLFEAAGPGFYLVFSPASKKRCATLSCHPVNELKAVPSAMTGFGMHLPASKGFSWFSDPEPRCSIARHDLKSCGSQHRYTKRSSPRCKNIQQWLDGLGQARSGQRLHGYRRNDAFVRPWDQSRQSGQAMSISFHQHLPLCRAVKLSMRCHRSAIMLVMCGVLNPEFWQGLGLGKRACD